MIKLAWFIALGGALGSVARFFLTVYLQQRGGTLFPIGTLAVNIIGSLLVGFLLTYALGVTTVSPELRAMLTTGFCGGFTTFSTFSYETVTLLQGGEARRALLYIAASVVFSILAAAAGIYLGAEALAMRAGSATQASSTTPSRDATDRTRG